MSEELTVDEYKQLVGILLTKLAANDRDVLDKLAAGEEVTYASWGTKGMVNSEVVTFGVEASVPLFEDQGEVLCADIRLKPSAVDPRLIRVPSDA